MTEGQWRASNDPEAMLAFLRSRPTSPRKLRLFACACCRRIWHALKSERVREVIGVVERFADRRVSLEELSEAMGKISLGDHPAACAVVQPEAMTAALGTAGAAAQWGGITAEWAGSSYNAGHFAEVVAQASLLREVFGNPLRSFTLEPGWLSYEQGVVVRLAEAIYEERAFERMPYLGDALEEAGCHDANLLDHCRREGAHTRGCWVVDMVLARD
jgi:hypothetical protein